MRASSSGRDARSSCRYCSICACIVGLLNTGMAIYTTQISCYSRMLSLNRGTENACLTFHVTIFVLKSFSFQLLLRFICSDLRSYFVSVLQITSVSLSVSLNDIMLVSVSVNEYITVSECQFLMHVTGCAVQVLISVVLY